MNIKTNYEEKRNEEKNGIELYFEEIPTPEERTELKENGFRWHGLKKCWYKSQNTQIKEEKQINNYENLIKLNNEEIRDVAKKLWNDEKMQNYIIDKYEFYKTKDNLIIELEKVNKITIDKTMYYDDEMEAPIINENNFIIYNRHNIPGRNLEEYLQEKENLNTRGIATGRYDYKGIYFVAHYYNNDDIVSCGWVDEKDKYFKRYLTLEEQEDYIKIMRERKEQYIERLKKYFKRYNKNITTYGYWANR